MYSILQKLLHYRKITKPKGYPKLVIQIFAKVKYFFKCHTSAMTLGQNFWDIIVIISALNSLYKDFNTTTTSFLKTNDKTINHIQIILQSKLVKNISKRAMSECVGNLVMFLRYNSSSVPNSSALKRKVNSYAKCYNCHKLAHLGRDCLLLDRKLN